MTDEPCKYCTAENCDDCPRRAEMLAREDYKDKVWEEMKERMK